MRQHSVDPSSALALAREAVELYEQLAKQAPATFGQDLVHARRLLARIPQGLGPF
ncbi:hypothetical protein [Streptomyces marokkonensis]|uniref:hypothetical protein n=1 Tax=Streptomyces marokkonensis TaxID=324855 RepID=UPI00142F08F4|nr:hypothetical protein [Streptomyces marokkonensis]